MIEFDTHLEWSNYLERAYGAANWVCEDRGDDGNWIAFYKTTQWTKSFVYNGKTKMGEV